MISECCTPEIGHTGDQEKCSSKAIAKKKRNDCMWLIYKQENETKRQMVEKYKGRRKWMNISIYRNGDEGERNKGSNGK